MERRPQVDDHALDEDADSCPKCHKRDQVVRVSYGYPSPEGIEAANRGEISLGGCVQRPDSPKFICQHCKFKFGAFFHGGFEDLPREYLSMRPAPPPRCPLCTGVQIFREVSFGLWVTCVSCGVDYDLCTSKSPSATTRDSHENGQMR